MTLGEGGTNIQPITMWLVATIVDSVAQEGKPTMSFHSLQPPWLPSSLGMESRPLTMAHKALQGLHLAHRCRLYLLY